MKSSLVEPTAESRTTDWKALDAESRVNLVRITAIAGFYAVHLVKVYGPVWSSTFTTAIGFDSTTQMANLVHVSVTALVLGWLMQAFGVHFLLHQQRLVVGSITATTLGDLFWLTAILCLSTGPAGPMVVGYFLIIMLAGLRFDLRLVRMTTIATIVAYLGLLGAVKWPIGLMKEIAIESVPRYHQVMFVVALMFAGIITGQTVRHAYAISRRESPTRQDDQS